MKYTYRFDKHTREFLYKEEGFLNPLETKRQGKEVYLLPADSTFVPCTLEPKEGFAIVWDYTNWIYIEDHRRKYDTSGVIIENSGTPYWLDGDTWNTSPRYMSELGSLPENAILTRPEKTEEELQRDYTKLIQSILDIEAQKLGYDNCLSVCSYMDTGVQKFDDEGTCFRKWRSAVWNKGYELLDKVTSGEMEIPSEEELIEMLPKLELIYSE